MNQLDFLSAVVRAGKHRDRHGISSRKVCFPFTRSRSSLDYQGLTVSTSLGMGLFKLASHHTQRRLFSAVASDAALSYNGLSLPYRWLRDSCQCPNCVHPSTRQKLHRTSDIPTDVRPQPGGVRLTDDVLHISWAPDHQSHYPRDLIERYASSQNLRVFHKDVDAKRWDVAGLKSSPDLFLPYSSIHTPSGLLSAITQLTQYGLLFVTDVPNDKTSNEECELRILAQRFGEIRETFYGQTWDVKNVRNSKNIAYTNIHLDLHMDLLYVFAVYHCADKRLILGYPIDTSSIRLGFRSFIACVTAS